MVVYFVQYKESIVILPEFSMKGPNYIEWVLKSHLKLCYNQQVADTTSGEVIVMEDSASPHRSKVAKAARE